MIAHAEDCETVDLPHHFSIHIDHEGAPIDHLLDKLLDAVRPEDLRLDGLFHMGILYHRGFLHTGPVVRLPEDVADHGEAGGYFFFGNGRTKHQLNLWG